MTTSGSGTWLEPKVSKAELSLQRTRDPMDIDCIRSAITSINEELASTPRETEIQRLKQLRLEHQRLLSPFYRIPTELLAHIFQYAIEKNSFGWKPQHFRSDTGRLGHICRRWREVAQSVPGLWVNILVMINPNVSYPQLAFQRLKDHLDRSADSPLVLEVKVVTDYSTGNGSPSLKMLDLVLQQSHRWKSFKYAQSQNGDFGHAVYAVLALTQKTPALEYLDVELHYAYDQLALRLLHLPLQSIRLSFGANRMSPFLERIPNLLTELCVKVYTRDAVFLASACRSLVSAQFILVVEPNNAVDVLIAKLAIKHQTLREMTVESQGQEGLRQIQFFLPALTCSSLTFLSIATNALLPSNKPGISSSFADRLIQFFQRSNSSKTLKSFRLVDTSLNTPDIVDILCAIPSIRSLEIHITNVNRFFLALNLTPSTSVLSRIYHTRTVTLPMLREAKFTLEEESELFELENMLRSRLDEGLKSVFVKILGEVQERDQHQLRWFEWVNSKTDLAVRIVSGHDEREVVGYWVKPAVGLRRHCWRDLLSV
ncbi:hypothetical protein L218DRAFT_1080297 [Marasmius fiardii PR-910]|nr:hypothetical protein L218DRAFT_1080297 [Marasmius fiardii PR-910]